jgi:C-terminal processing protease CtpA/Prc
MFFRTILIILAAAQTGGDTSALDGDRDPARRAAYAKSLHDLHEHLGAVYPNFKLKGIDWDAVGRELLPRAAKAKSDREFGLLVEELVAKLEDSHAWVEAASEKPPVPPLPEWGPAIACLIDDRGRPVVYYVARQAAAWKAGLRPGMAVVSVNGVKADEAIEQCMKQWRTYVGYSSERYLKYDAVRFFLRQQTQGARVTIVVEKVDGAQFRADLTADARGWYIPRLPVQRAGIRDGGGDVQSVKLHDGVGYIHVRRIRQGLEAALDQSMSSLGELKGLIIDVRGNSGGGFDSGTAFRNFETRNNTNGAASRRHYGGPIALLIDERCISAGEGWASWFVANKRARLFGTATAGASARKEMYMLANGMYKVQVPVKAYTGFLNRPIERQGIEPDVDVRIKASDLAAGRDTVAEAALKWLSATAAGPP